MNFMNPWIATEWLIDGWPWRWPGYFSDIDNYEATNKLDIKGDSVAEKESTEVTESDKKADEALDTIYDAMEQFFKASGMHGSMTMTRNGKTRHYEFGNTDDVAKTNSTNDDDRTKSETEKKKLYNKLVETEEELSKTKDAVKSTVAAYNKMVDEHNELLLKYQYMTGPSLGYLPQQTHIKLYF